MTNDLTDKLREVLATRKAAHALWHAFGGDTKKNRRRLGDADDALELFVHAESYSIADELDRLNALVERLGSEKTAANKRSKTAVDELFTLESKADALAKMLDTAKAAIEQAPDDAFGWGDTNNYGRYALKHELLSNMEAELTAYRGDS